MSMLIKTLAAGAAATVLATSTFAHSGDSCRLRENAIKRIFAKGWIADSSR